MVTGTQSLIRDSWGQIFLEIWEEHGVVEEKNGKHP
jgi:hypothetical protein